jgi:5-methylcytosine-specific restriction endonuclease McrA
VGRIYDTRRWQRLRKHKLREHPLCEACLQIGQIEPAIAVDHRVRIATGGEPYPALEGLASLCARHHNAKTRAEQMGEENYILKAATFSDIRLTRGTLGIEAANDFVE